MKTVKHSELCNMPSGTVFMADNYERPTVMERGCGGTPHSDFFFITTASPYDIRSDGIEAGTMDSVTEIGRADIANPVVGGRDGLFEQDANYLVFESLDEFHRYTHEQALLPYRLESHIKGPTQAQMAEEDLVVDEFYCMEGNVAMARLVAIGHEFGRADHKTVHLEVVDNNPLYFSAAIQTMPLERFLAQFHHFNTDLDGYATPAPKTVKEVVAKHPEVIAAANNMAAVINGTGGKKE